MQFKQKSNCLPPPNYVVKKHIQTTQEEREAFLKDVGYNIFNYPARGLAVDLLTDSGTGALTQSALSALLMSDESYSRHNWYYGFLEAFRDYCERGKHPKKAYLKLMDPHLSNAEFREAFMHSSDIERDYSMINYDQHLRPNLYILPQGRCCEHLLFDNLKSYRDATTEGYILSNGLFDTTRGNLMQAGFLYKDFPLPIEPTNPNIDYHHNEFKGDLDLDALRAFIQLKQENHEVFLVVLTITNNMYGGQPVSMRNIKETRKLCDEYGVPLWFDGCRMNENAYFIQQYEDGYRSKDVRQILKEMFSYCDGFHMSMKKVLCSMGGVMHVGEGMVKRFPGLNKTLKSRQIGNYSNDSQGGLSGRDLAACTLALYEASSQEYLETRIGQVSDFGMALKKSNIPIIWPPGGHCIFIKVGEIFPDRPWDDYVAYGLAIELVRQYGIRTVELSYLGGYLDLQIEKNGNKLPEKMPHNFIRMTVPSYMYHKEHLDYVVQSLVELIKDTSKIPKVRIVSGKNDIMRAFSLEVEPVYHDKQ